jgi:hypothetical protein
VGKTNGHAGEAAAAGMAGGTAAGLAHDHNRTAQTDAPPKRRGLFGGGFGRKKGGAYDDAPMQTTQQQTYPAHQPVGTGAGGIGSGGAPTSPAVADRERGAVGVPDQAGSPGGAWAGSRLASEDAEQRGAWAGSGNRATVCLEAQLQHWHATATQLCCECSSTCHDSGWFRCLA